jgi:hypothetical protein
MYHAAVMADSTTSQPQPAPDPNQPAATTPPTAPAPAKKKSRRLWLKIPLALLVLLILLVLLLPTIASTGIVRSIVLNKVNQNLNGKVEAADWSIGWFGGIDARGIKVLDAKGEPIVQLDHFSTQLPLTRAIFGKLPLGKVIIDGLTFNVAVNENDQLNLNDLVKISSESNKPTKTTSSKLPDVSADVQITNVHGSVMRPGKPTVAVTSLTGSIKVPDITQPITNDLDIGVKVGNNPEGKITTNGTATISKDGTFNPNVINAHQVLDVQNFDLHAALPFLNPKEIDNVAGASSAHVVFDFTDGKAVSLDANLGSKDVAVSGPALKGDTFSSKSFALTIPKLGATFPDGVSNWKTGWIKVGPNADGSGEKPVELKFDQAQFNLAVDLKFQSLLKLKENEKPGAAGRVAFTSAIDLAALAGQLRNTLGISPDVTIASGQQTQSVTVILSEDKTDAGAVVDIKDVKGTRAGKPIALQPVHLELGASDLGGGGGKLPDVRDLKLVLQSAFANGEFHGKTLADLAGQLNGQLEKGQAELAQFMDFGDKKLAGTFNITLANQGDLTAPDSMAKVSATATLTNLKLGDEINQPWIKAAFDADLHHGTNAFIDTVKNVVVTLQTSSPQSPTVDVRATADADLSSGVKAKFAVAKANVDLARLQSEFARFFPADVVVSGGTIAAATSGDGTYETSADATSKKINLPGVTLAVNHATVQKKSSEGKLNDVLRDYTLNVDTAASADVTSASTTAHITKLSLTDSQQMLSVTKPGSDLTVNLPKGGSIGGSGAVALGVDLSKLNPLLRAWSGNEAVVSGTARSEIRSGNLALTLALAPSGTTTSITGDGGINGLVISSATGQTQPQDVKITLRAASSPDALTASQISVNSKFANLDVTDALINMTATSALAKLQKAKLAIDVPDVPLADSLRQALIPPAASAAAVATSTPPAQTAGPGLHMASAFSSPPAQAPPPKSSGPLFGSSAIAAAVTGASPAAASPPPAAPPLIVTAGSLSMHADISHSGSTLLVNVPDITGKNIAFVRGTIAYQVKPINMQIAMSVEPGDGKTTTRPIQKIQVTQLAGDLGVAKLSMPTPILVTNFDAPTPTANGVVKLDGKLEDVTELLTALQGQKPDAMPYRGDLTATETIGSGPSGINLAGGANIAKFQVLRAGNPNDVAFNEDQVVLANDISMASDYNAIAIKNLSAAMQSSGALNLSLANGSIDDLSHARKLNLAVNLQYDLAKLWPIVHPMLLTPGQEDQYKDLKIEGDFKKLITLHGNYPANLPMQQAIKTVLADGSLKVGLFDYNGLHVENMDVPVTLRDGKATTVYAAGFSADAPTGNAPTTGPTTAPVATANGGQLDLNNVTIDLTQDPPRVSTIDNKPFLTHVSINPLFADSWMNKVINNPVFVGTKQATGLIDMTIVSCKDLPAGKLALSSDPKNTGKATFKYSLTNLHIGSEGLGDTLGKIMEKIGAASGREYADSFQADVKDATTTLAGGIVTQSAVFQTGKYPLGFTGNVRMSDNQMMPVTVDVPLTKLLQVVHVQDQRVLGALPEHVPAPFFGVLSNPQTYQLDAGPITNAFTQSGFKALGNFAGDKWNKELNKLGGNSANDQTSGNGSNGTPASQPAFDPNNPLGSFLNIGQQQLQHQLDKQQQKNQQQNQQQPQR